MTESQRPPTRPHSNPLRPVIFVAIVLVAVSAVVGISKWYTPPELVPWQSDLTAAQAQSRSTGKPILLYFTAEWCGPCQGMRRTVWPDPQVADAAKPFIPVRLDVDREPALAKKYQIEAMPTFILLTPDGQVVRTFTGAMESDQMIAWLKGGR